LKEVSYSLIDNENIRGKFYIYIFGLFIFFLCEYLAIKLFFSLNLSLFIYLIKCALMLIIFYPISKIFISFENYNEK
jgi:positive regulator of sigma E activity